MKKNLFLLLVFLAQEATSQLIIKGIELDRKRARSSQILEEKPPVLLPFWDDFSYAGDKPDSLWEFSNSIFVNEAIAIDPPSFKVATFDGMDSLGHLYDGEELFPDLTDQLISRRIKLADLRHDESIYLSFFWQAGGNGEMPEGADSLRLQFLTAENRWVTKWKKRGDNVNSNDSFTQVILKVDQEYRHDNFRFKFESFGSLQGPFDSWNVDYVYLNKGRSMTDLTFFDRAFTGSLSSLVTPYHEMPSSHFFKNPAKYIAFQNFQVNNLDVTPHTLALDYKLVNTRSGETVHFDDDENVFLSGQLKTIRLSQKPTINPQASPPDSVVFEVTLTSNFNDPSLPINFRINDSLRAKYTFQNYYSYDDGVAEFAAGVRQNKGSIAMEYVLEIQDTLSHLDIYFPSISPSSIGSSINVNIWKRLDGSSPISSKSYTISLSRRNEFTRIQLPVAKIVQDTIYIGFTQNTAEYIGVGVDRSNLLAKDKVFYQTSGPWQPNSLVNGVLMIRPVFASEHFALGIKTHKSGIPFYPNPTSGHLYIPDTHTHIQVLSLDGKIRIKRNYKPSYDLSTLTTGIYLLRVFNGNNQLSTFKIIKN